VQGTANAARIWYSETIQISACFPANIAFQPPSANDGKAAIANCCRKGTFLPGVPMHRNQMIILAGLRSFVITSGDGLPDNQYRIRNQHVEFRSFSPDGPASEERHWRVLEPDEVQLHFVLHTPVADWLDKRLYSARPMAA